MPFTAQELENIANTTLDFHMKGKVHSNTIQDKPLLRKLMAQKKTFPGGKEFITERVKGTYSTGIEGFSHDDEVSYGNPANVKQAQYPWREIHAGISFTMTELKIGGITVVDSMTGKNTAQKTEAEKIQLANLLDDKMEDMSEGSSRGLNLMLWRDGTQDTKLVPGIRYFIRDDPTLAVVIGGIDQGANTWWRNRASLAIDTSTASNNNLINELQKEFRQLRRYGGRPDCFLAGSDFMDAMEKEMRAKGTYTDRGWKDTGGRLDPSMDDLAFKGVMIEYDPTLDDEGLSKYGYTWDSRHIRRRPMDGEDGKQHNPARPENKYVVYRAVTWTMGLTARQRNSAGVYSIA